MRKLLLQGLLLGAIFLVAEMGLTSCSSSAHCPAVAGTGNSATHKGGAKRKYCAGVNGTGNIKPKVRNKREDGLTSKKMERQMAKTQSKKAGPLESKKLSMEQ